MKPKDRTVQVLTQFLEDAPDRAPDQLLETILTDLLAVQQRAGWRSTPGRLPMLGPNLARYGAVVGVFGIAVIAAFALWAGAGNQIGPPGVTTRPSPTSPSPTTTASSTPTATATSAPDTFVGWPGSIRLEAGGPPAVIVSATDAEGDAGPAGLGYADIVAMQFNDNVSIIQFLLASSIPDFGPAWGEAPFPERRIAYGLVIDLNADGIADVRAGMEHPNGEGPAWLWLTDFATGLTASCICVTAALGDVVIEAWYPQAVDEFPDPYPAAWGGGTAGRLALGSSSDTALRYYIWASTIDNDEITATDFAPDSGWLSTNP